MKNADEITTSDYSPYEAFWEGFVDYRDGLHRNPYQAMPTQGVEARAWDRGREASMRVTRAIGGV
jgi:hypothetical protein